METVDPPASGRSQPEALHRAGLLAIVVLPGALTVLLSFRSGGYFPAPRRSSRRSSRCC